MISKIVIPDLGATSSDVVLREWLVQIGDTVKIGQPLFVIETDKATVEVEAFRDGLVRALLVGAGNQVPIGTVVALVADSASEPIAAEMVSAGAIEVSAGLAGDGKEHAWAPEPVAAEGASEGETRVLASPLARRIAEAEGLNLVTIRGSGRQGQILKRDVMEALAQRQTAIPTATGAASEIRRPLTPMRRTIAQRTRRSKHEAPHFYANITVNMAAALQLRQEAAGWAEQKGWAKPSIGDLCLRAAALSLRDVPELNSSLQEDEIVTYQAIHIGLVVGLEEGGMLIPVVRGADQHNLFTLAALTRRLRERAGQGILSDQELSGGTFTLSNLGMYGLDSFTAVINPPQAAILALGAVQERPAVVGDAVVPQPLMTAVLSADHRLVDGIAVARFMGAWKAYLEHPYRLTLSPPEEAGR